jgi:hypothetical protein
MATALTADRTHLLEIIRGEFTEMPDMHLTRDQFRRLWALTTEECDDLLGTLVQSNFLVVGRRDLYRRNVEA